MLNREIGCVLPWGQLLWLVLLVTLGASCGGGVEKHDCALEATVRNARLSKVVQSKIYEQYPHHLFITARAIAPTDVYFYGGLSVYNLGQNPSDPHLSATYHVNNDYSSQSGEPSNDYLLDYDFEGQDLVGNVLVVVSRKGRLTIFNADTLTGSSSSTVPEDIGLSSVISQIDFDSDVVPAIGCESDSSASDGSPFCGLHVRIYQSPFYKKTIDETGTTSCTKLTSRALMTYSSTNYDNDLVIANKSQAEHGFDAPTYALVTSASDNKIFVIDITVPSSPMMLGSDPVETLDLEGIYIYNEVAYLGGFGQEGLSWLELSNLDSAACPELADDCSCERSIAASLDLPHSSLTGSFLQMVSAMDTDSYGARLFSANWASPGGLVIFSIADDGTPTEEGNLSLDALSVSNRVNLMDAQAFLALETSTGGFGMVDLVQSDGDSSNVAPVLRCIQKDSNLQKVYALAIYWPDQSTSCKYIYTFASSDDTDHKLHIYPYGC